MLQASHIAACGKPRFPNKGKAWGFQCRCGIEFWHDHCLLKRCTALFQFLCRCFQDAFNDLHSGSVKVARELLPMRTAAAEESSTFEFSGSVDRSAGVWPR